MGLTPAVPSPQLDAYLHWIAGEYHGAMGYMARADRVARRRDLNVVLPGARSLIMVGLDYGTAGITRDVLQDPSRGRISNYAWGVDYHDLMTPRLEALVGWFRAETRHELAYRVYVDTGAILERSHARQAGFGFTGKNTMLIHPQRGSYFFLGEIITTFEFAEYDNPQSGVSCGRCRRCQDACPTDAFPQSYLLDARRCISYLTIEHKGAVPADLRSKMGNWVYGCDICQIVCPFNRFAVPTQESLTEGHGIPSPSRNNQPPTTDGDQRFLKKGAFHAQAVDRAAPPLVDLLALTPDTFKQRFAGTPILRIKRDRLVRNACVAAGNWRGEAALPHLERLAGDESALVREHALWALAQY